MTFWRGLRLASINVSGMVMLLSSLLSCVFLMAGDPFRFCSSSMVVSGGPSMTCRTLVVFALPFSSKEIITCNLEYRRLGDSGGGWPGTFQDISLATNHVLKMFSSDPRVNVSRTAVLGHSAGGHLALWLAGRHRVMQASPLDSSEKYRIRSAVSLAGVCDLRTAWKQRLGNGVVARLMGGTPDEYPDRYDAGSPIELLPSGARQVLIHGTADVIVPVSQSERFVERAERLGEQPTLVKLEEVGHFELIDPESDAWRIVARAVLPLLGLKSRS